MGQDSPLIKPAMWGIDPGVIAYNCWKWGFPVPVLAVPFWEGAGDKVYDISGNGNHGTLINGPKWTAGKFGNALRFDGVDDYVNLGSQSSLGASLIQMTVSCWVKKLSNNTVDALVWHLADSSSGSYRILTVTDGSIQWMVGSYLNAYSVSGAPITGTTDYYHLSFTFNGIQLDAYKNGILIGTDNVGAYIPTNGETNIARHPLGGSYAYPGHAIIDNVMIFNRALTAAQIKFLHDNPYFMFQPIPVPYGYVAAAGGLSIPVAMHHYQHNIRI